MPQHFFRLRIFALTLTALASTSSHTMKRTTDKQLSNQLPYALEDTSGINYFITLPGEVIQYSIIIGNRAAPHLNLKDTKNLQLCSRHLHKNIDQLIKNFLPATFIALKNNTLQPAERIKHINELYTSPLYKFVNETDLSVQKALEDNNIEQITELSYGWYFDPMRAFDIKAQNILHIAIGKKAKVTSEEIVCDLAKKYPQMLTCQDVSKKTPLDYCNPNSKLYAQLLSIKNATQQIP